MTGGGEDAAALSAKVADAFVAFARSGDPNHAGLPRWDPMSAEGSATMIFDVESRFERDHDADERAAIR